MSDSAGSEAFGQDEVGRLRAEVAGLKAAIGSLRAEIAGMRAAADGLFDIQGDENVAPGNGFIEMDRSVARHPVVRFRADRLPSGGGGGGPMRPFDIHYDKKAKAWKIFLPKGCVLVYGVNDSYGKDASYANGTDTDGMATITPSREFWAHVNPDGYGHYEFTIDGDESPGGPQMHSFKIAELDTSLSRVTVQHVNGCVRLERMLYKGDDTNIVFRDYNDTDDNDKYGRTVVDVYYV